MTSFDTPEGFIMRIAGLQKLTLLDFPGKTAATVFTPGCNFRCPFCHNGDLVVGAQVGEAFTDALHCEPTPNVAHHSGSSAFPEMSVSEVLGFLDKRQGLLDGVCITGGEPLLQSGLADFCAQIRERGFAVKLDTNGSFPDRLRVLIEAGLVDYVAMDIKNTPARYAETVGIERFDVEAVRASIEILREKRVPFEFRTTVVRELHTPNDLRDLASWIAGTPAIDTPDRPATSDAQTPSSAPHTSMRVGHTPAWFLQNYVDSEGVLAGEGHLHAWDPDELRAIARELQAQGINVNLRGIDAS